MTLDRQSCYRAMTSHDARFDGRFFIGVRTTGIYCRPVCRVRLPRLENVVFYPCAAAAEQAGFRACRRCRPETAPGSAAWQGTSATVARAMRLIDAGALDGASVGDLAGRLGVSERHLRRLFEQHLGAAPNQIALTRRLHLARRLLDDTDLSIAAIALAAGFGSIRRFNAAMQASFGDAPSHLRRIALPKRARSAAALRGRAPRGGEAAATAFAQVAAPTSTLVTLRLGYRPPMDWPWMLSFLGARAIAGVESVQSGTYRRTVRAGDVVGSIEIGCDEERRELVATLAIQDPAALAVISRRLARSFDCHADPDVIASVLGRDPHLRSRIQQRPGLRAPVTWEPFEAAVRAVVGQQISVAAARTILARLAQRFGTRIEREGIDSACVFPTAEQLAEADLDDIGMPRARIETLKALARAVVSGQLPLDDTSDPHHACEAMLRVRGIGQWTAGYVAMRGLGDPDAMPYGDLGLLRAMRKALPEMNAARLEAHSHAWRPWRAYAAIHLWSHDGCELSTTADASNGRARRSRPGARTRSRRAA